MQRCRSFPTCQILIDEFVEALETECEIWNQAGLTVEKREIVLSDEKVTGISDMLDAMFTCGLILPSI